MKDVKKLLSANAKAILPDDNVKKNIKRELGMEETDATLVYAHGGERVAANLKIKFLSVCAAAMAIVLTLCFLIPALKKSGLSGTGSGNKFMQITDADSFYAYGAASVGILLSASGPAQTTEAISANADTDSGKNGAIALAATTKSSAVSSAKTFSSGVPANQDVSLPSESFEDINRYMSLVESLLSEGSIEGTGIAGEKGYSFGMSVQYTDLLGGIASYTMYYDKIFLYGETDGDEREENYAIKGILCTETAEYSVEGNYETENESDESESELYFKAFTDDTRSSYIEVEQQYESEEDGQEIEREYVYSVYRNGKLTEKTVIEYESEDGELELLLEITKDEKTETLTFRDVSENGERILQAKGTFNGERVQFRVYIRQGKYHYVFQDGSSSDFDRLEDDDDDREHGHRYD